VLITLVSLTALAMSLMSLRLTDHTLATSIERYVQGSSLSEGGVARLLFAIESPQDTLDNKVLKAGSVTSQGLTYKIAAVQAQLSPTSSDMPVLERYVIDAGNEAAWPNLESQLIEARSTRSESLAYETFVAAMAGTIAPSDLTADITAWPHGAALDLASATASLVMARQKA
jgi:hypothetical protein